MTPPATICHDFAALPARYEAVFARGGETSVFHTLPWFRNYIQTVLAPNQRARIYAVETAAGADASRAVLPMHHLHPGAGWLSARRLSGLSNYYSSLFGPVIEPRESGPQALCDLLAAAIAADDPRWDVIDLHPLACDATLFPALTKALGSKGLLVYDYLCFGNWFLQVHGRTYAQYHATLPSQIRNTIKRKKKQFEKSPNSRIIVYRDAAGLDEAMRAYEQIYASSWKVPEPYPEFIRGLCRACADAGWLRLGVAWVDDQPAAAQIWIIVGGTASIYKLAYDERFAKLSLGSILTAQLMEQAIDADKVHEVDYLTGDDAYKKDWMSDRRERRGIVAFNPRTPLGLSAAARHIAGRTVRRAVDALRRLRRTAA